MKVSELAREAGTTTKAIRFYEAEGVLPPAPRAANGYRQYDTRDLCRLRVLVALRGLGVPLADSGRLASLCAAERCAEMATDLLQLIGQRRQEVAAARAELDHLAAELDRLESALNGAGAVTQVCCEGGEERC